MASPSRGIQILHVDDDPQFADLAATYLQREDERFAVTTASDATEGFDRLREADFDCIVSDFDMPGQNGLEFLDAVRTEFPTIPFVLFTGKGSEEIASRAISAGVTDYIQKRSGTDQYTILANRIGNAVDQVQAIREIDQSYRAMDTAAEGLSLVRPDGTFSYVNPAFAHLFGFEPDELIGVHWTVLYHNEEARRLENDILPAVVEHGYWSGETVRLTKAGERLVTDHRLAHTEDDVIVCTATDVTPERTAPGQRTTGFDLLVDAMDGHAFYTLDHEGYITRWNEGAERLTGYSADEIIGAHIGIFFTETDREEDRPEELIETAKVEGSVTDQGRRVRKDGSRFRAVDTLSASYDADGTIRGFGKIDREASDEWLSVH